jgi:beta-lactamase class A
MAIGISRRLALASTGAAMLGGMAPADLKGLESISGGRLGFALLDTGTGQMSGHRLDERFAMCSVFKLILAGLILQAADRSDLKLDARIPMLRADLVPHSPVTAPMVGESLTILDLARAAQVRSDNMAANLLLEKLGGPAGFTRRLAAMGDRVTRLDRYEPDLNRVIAPDPRDTTTPRAMAKTAADLLTGNLLRAESRALLAGWTIETTTGLRRLRAATPPHWRAGDKTGTCSAKGMPDRINDVAIFWPPNAAPLVAAAFYEAPGEFAGARPRDEAVLAQAMQISLSSSYQI